MNDNVKDKLLASFIVCAGFWLMNISYTRFSNITMIISGLAGVFLLVFSIKAINKEEKVLGWAGLVTSAVAIILFAIPFIKGFFRIQ
ncbi:hypothetical protein J4423_03205 [Candidatus Pacearchaeota archaeon]|nr:hypothetical protein [Candidatus Pacearchaeota archaeon]